MDVVTPGYHYVQAAEEKPYTGGGAKFCAGDTLFARITPCLQNGKISQFVHKNLDEQGFGSTEFFVLRAIEGKSDPSFVYYLSQTDLLRQTAINSMVGASGRQRADVKVLRELEITLPPLDVQQRVGKTLSAFDELIENNRRRIALLEEAARLLYREWFVNLRFPGYESASIKNGLPDGWKSGYATDFIHILSGGTPDTKNGSFWGGEIPFFTPKDCSNSVYVCTTEKNLSEDGLTSCNSKLFPKETIFITARGTVGKLALAQQPMAMNQSCYALTPKGETNNLFLFLGLEERIVHLKAMASGGVFDAIVVDTFKKLSFTCPPPKLTEDFGTLVKPIFGQIENLLLQNAALSKARNALLPKLMSGEIQV